MELLLIVPESDWEREKTVQEFQCVAFAVIFSILAPNVSLTLAAIPVSHLVTIEPSLERGRTTLTQANPI
jgi:hypothetical protein